MRAGWPAVLAACALLLPDAAIGQERINPEPEYSRHFKPCLQSGDAAKGVTVAMASCFNAELTRQDQRLNKAYAAAMAAQTKAGQGALRTAQRAWIKRRDADCEKDLTGGTIDMLERAGCHLEMTTVRAIELERMAKGARAKPAAATSEARAFAYEAGVVDLLVIGPAAQTLFDRLPGKAAASACGGEGVHKGDGRMICTRTRGDYSCHLWLDVPKQALTNPETDDC